MLEETWKRSKYPPDDGQVHGQNEKHLDNGIFLGGQREHKTDAKEEKAGYQTQIF